MGTFNHKISPSGLPGMLAISFAMIAIASLFTPAANAVIWGTVAGGAAICAVLLRLYHNRQSRKVAGLNLSNDYDSGTTD